LQDRISDVTAPAGHACPNRKDGAG
jgi:hypothetical protein